MKVIMVSRQFPASHPRKGEATYFVEKIWNTMRFPDFSLPREMDSMIRNYSTLYRYNSEEYLKAIHIRDYKHHTIRSGARFKAGDMASLRVWSNKPYRSKQIECAQVMIKKVWDFNLHVVGDELLWKIPGLGGGDFDMGSKSLEVISRNDGLELRDFLDWFAIHPKAKGKAFTGQIICWGENINY